MHDYGYRQGLTPVNTPDYLTKGSFFHAVIAKALADGNQDFQAISLDLQREALKAQEPTVTEPDRNQVVTQLTDFFSEMGFPTGDAIVAVEEEFQVDLGWTKPDGSPVLLHGFIDAVVRETNGDLWLVEHKTASRAWSAQQFQFAIQDVLYCAAWEALTGERPVGVQYNFFYPKRWEVKTKYIEASQYASVLADVQASITLRETITAYPREPMWGCGGCQYRDLCYTELIGADGTFIREQQFTVDTVKRDRFIEGD